MWKYLTYISSITYWRTKISEFARHIAGRLSDDEKRFIPKEEHQTIFREARYMGLEPP